MTLTGIENTTPPEDLTALNQPELETNPHQSYDSYRTECEKNSGYLRIGIYDPATYDKIQGIWDPKSGLPIAATNESLDYLINKDLVTDDYNIAVIPEKLVNAIGINPEGIAVFKQLQLSPELVTEILNSPSEDTIGLINEELKADLSENEQLLSGGLPEYVVLSKYDTSDCTELKTTPPEDVVLDNGNYITTSREKILANLPELIKLHESVFAHQMMQNGYYSGMTEEGIRTIINNPDFTAVAGFDSESGEVLMFALFATDLKNTDAVPWINPIALAQFLEKDKTNKVLAIPLVITSKSSGLNMLSKTVILAGHEGLYRTKADTVYTLSDSSALSILYTPKVINRSFTKLGFVHQETRVEATFLTERVPTAE